MINNTLLALVILVIIASIFLANKLYNPNIIELKLEEDSKQAINSFSVKYKSEYSSSGATRKLNIVYDVSDGVIISCRGTYMVMSNSGESKTDCRPDQLVSGYYNVPVKLFKEVMTGSLNEGPAKASWEILLG